MNMYRDRQFGFIAPGALPPAIKNIMFINGVIYLMQWINPTLKLTLFTLFGLSPYEFLYEFRIWQIVTYLFLHGDFMHVFFNMFILWMFGSEIEQEWGTKQFLKYYFITGIGAGLCAILVSDARTIGASGAVYGIMIAFGLKYPNAFVIFPFPMRVKYLIGFLFLVSLLSTIGSAKDGIAHAAHLGGMVVGLIYLKYPLLLTKIKSSTSNLEGSWARKRNKSHLKYREGSEDTTAYYRRKIDELLDKINRVGYLNLTDEEKKLLDEGSKYLREHDQENYN